MKIVNFEEAKARKEAKEKVTKHLPQINNNVPELQKQYQEYVRFCNRWHEEHVAGQNGNGKWIYRNL